jgi:hypothetical protein
MDPESTVVPTGARGEDRRMRFQLNSPRVISETIQGETIIIHLGTGVYYSLRGSGAEIWDMLAGGADEQQVVAELESRYDAASAELAAAVSSLVEQLRAEDLISPLADADVPVQASTAPAARSEREAFEAPTVEKYADMQDIILLDPVHEVDGEGWPRPVEAQ